MDAEKTATYIDAYARGYRDAMKDNRADFDPPSFPLPIFVVLFVSFLLLIRGVMNVADL